MTSQRQYRWVQRGVSFSGRERHCCFLNLGGSRYADVSAISGLDFADDGRAVGRVDWDHDGDLDLWIANRNGPQLRFMRNDTSTDHHYLMFRLQGRTCNRDAVGARVELTLAGDPAIQLVRTLRAGDGYLSQSSKWVHFGLGDAARIDRLVVRWPGGDPEQFSGMQVDGRYQLVQGSGRAQPWSSAPPRSVQLKPTSLTAPLTSERARVVLSAPIALPKLTYQDWNGRLVELSGRKPVLINLWATWCQRCLEELAQLDAHRDRLSPAVDVVALSVDSLKPAGDHRASPQDVLRRVGYRQAAGLATPNLVDKLQLAHDVAFDVRIPLPIPTSLLVDAQVGLLALYRGPVDVEQLLRDARRWSARHEPDGEAGVPFSGRWFERRRTPRLLPLAWDLLRHGYIEEGLEYITRQRSHLRRDPEYAKLLARSGFELLERGDAERAAQQYRRAIEANPKTVVAHLNLGYALIQQGRDAEALAVYREALVHIPEDPRLHFGLAWLLATATDPQVRNGAEAVHWGEKAAAASNYQHAPALEALAAAHAETGRFDLAVATARKALERAQAAGDAQQLDRIKTRLHFYDKGQLYYRQPSKK